MGTIESAEQPVPGTVFATIRRRLLRIHQRFIRAIAGRLPIQHIR